MNSTPSSVPNPQATERNERKVMRGMVTSKFVSRKTKLYAHDEKGEANVGDVVEVCQTRPLSKLKRWRLVRIVQKATK